jgi:hypothetical protein
MSIENKKQKHSELGIASLLINIFIILYFVLGEIVPYPKPEFFVPPTSRNIYFASPFLFIVALGLGIGGLIQKDRKKLFAILGTVISTLTFVFICFALIVWIASY